MSKPFPQPLSQEKRDEIWRLARDTEMTQKAIAEQTGVAKSTVRAIEVEHGYIRRPQAKRVIRQAIAERKQFDLNTIEGAEAAVKHYGELKEQAERALRNALQSTMDMVSAKLATLNTEADDKEDVVLG